MRPSLFAVEAFAAAQSWPCSFTLVQQRLISLRLDGRGWKEAAPEEQQREKDGPDRQFAL